LYVFGNLIATNSSQAKLTEDSQACYDKNAQWKPSTLCLRKVEHMDTKSAKPICDLCGAPAERLPSYLTSVNVTVRCQKCVLKRSPKAYEQTSTWPKHADDPTEALDVE